MGKPIPVAGLVASEAQERPPYAQLQNLTDERLVLETQAGNADAFAVIFQRYHRLAHVTALSILRDAAEAEDLTQTVFLEVYRHLGQFDPGRGKFRIWLLQFAYCRSMHRRNYLFVRQFHNHVELGEATKKEAEGCCSSPRLQPQESGRLAAEVLAALPEPQRRTMEMYFFEGLSFHEIAQRRNETFANVRHHFYRGLERLRRYMESGAAAEIPRTAPAETGEAGTL